MSFGTARWGRNAYGFGEYGGGPYGLSLLSQYSFYVDPPNLKDLVSGNSPSIVFDAGGVGYSPNYTGGGLNEAVFEESGAVLSGGVVLQVVPYSSDTSNWTGSGPWTETVNVTETTTHTLSTDLNGVTVSIAAGTATIDGPASATFGNPDQFVVSGAGTLTITTDIADPKAQITASTYKLPYLDNPGSGTISAAARFSDATDGIKYNIGPALPDLDSDNWQEVGDEKVTNTDLEVNDDYWSVANSDETTIQGRNVTNPISGVADYKLTTTIAGTANSYPRITIDFKETVNWLGKHWKTRFDYKVNSGTCFLRYIRLGSGTLVSVLETLSGSGSFLYRQTSDDVDDVSISFLTLYFDGNDQFETQIDNASVKQIEPSTAWTTMGQNLLDSLDGVADGVEQITAPYDMTNAAWNSIATPTITATTFKASAQNDRVYEELISVAGAYYEISFDAYVESGGQTTGYSIHNFGTGVEDKVIILSESSQHFFNRVEGDGTTLFTGFKDGNTSSWATVNVTNFSVKEISDAKGKAKYKWTPKWSAADVTGQINILTANDEATSFLFYDADTSEIKLFDGTNTAVKSLTVVANTTYEIDFEYGVITGQQMRVGVDGSFGSYVTNVGSFPNDTVMSIAWEAAEFAETELISWEKEL